MPTLSMFYGIIVRMYFFDDKQHHEPHIHVEYADSQAVINITDGNVLAGELPRVKQSWCGHGLKSIKMNLSPAGNWP